MKLKYTKDINLDLDSIADALLEAMEDQLNDELEDLVATDAEVEFLDQHRSEIKKELFPIIGRRLMAWRNKND